MSRLCDVTADLPRLANLEAVRGLTAEETASLAEELTAYHQHFAPLFYRRRHRSIRDECFADYRNVIFASPHVWVRDPIIETVRDQHAVRFLALKQILED